jgi:Protein of unknown function (DUF3631)
VRSGNRGGGAPTAPSPQAAAFLHETFRYGENGVLLGWSKSGSQWWRAHELDAAAAGFVAHGAERDIWMGCGLRAEPSANGGRGTDRDVVAIPGLWADIDERPADVIDALNALECPPSVLVESGHGVHAWWLLDELWTFADDDDRVEARTLLRRLHAFLRTHVWKVDAVHDLARVLRVPGTLNYKQSPPAPVVLHENGQPRRYAFSDLDDWLPPGEPAPLPGDHKPPPAADIGGDELDRLAASYAAGDERFAKTWARSRPELGSASEYDLAVCVKGADMGVDDAACWSLVRRWRQLHGEDPGKAERADYAAATLAKARAGEPPTTVRLESGDVAALLDDTYKFIRRFVVCSEAGRAVGALWVAHTHAFDAADYTPRLSIRSAEAESGKTRYLEVLKLVVRAAQPAVNISDAALFRVVEARCPTVLHDEIDAVFGPKARDREDMRGMLNAGFERGATVPRCVGEGSRQEVHDFAVFAPVAVAGLHKLPHTLETRSIVVRMKPRTADEKIERLRKRKIKDEAALLRARWEAWAEAHVEVLTGAEPNLPDELSDRAQDIWEPLFAIADLAGDEWAKRARAAAVELYAARDQDDDSIGRRLLADIRAVFDDPDRDDPVDDEKGQAITSGNLAAALAAIEGGLWAEWGKDDKPVTATKVARMLRPFGIGPDQYKVAGRKIRGYLRSDFHDAWRRHLPSPPGVSGTGAEVVPPNPNKGNGGTSLNGVPLHPGKGSGS